MINIYEGGMYEEGFWVVFISLINCYVCEKGYLKEKDDNFFGEDICEGFIVVVFIKFGEL